MPNNFSYCQRHENAEKMPNYDVHAKQHFIMTNKLLKSQIYRICNCKCQAGNAGQRCRPSTVTCGKTPTAATLRKHLKIRCHVTVTQ